MVYVRWTRSLRGRGPTVGLTDSGGRLPDHTDGALILSVGVRPAGPETDGEIWKTEKIPVN